MGAFLQIYFFCDYVGALLTTGHPGFQHYFVGIGAHDVNAGSLHGFIKAIIFPLYHAVVEPCHVAFFCGDVTVKAYCDRVNIFPMVASTANSLLLQNEPVLTSPARLNNNLSHTRVARTLLLIF